MTGLRFFVFGVLAGILSALGLLLIHRTLSTSAADYRRQKAICTHKGGEMLFNSDTTACYIQIPTSPILSPKEQDA